MILLAARVNALFYGDVIKIGSPEILIAAFIFRHDKFTSVRHVSAVEISYIPVSFIGYDGFIPPGVADDERVMAEPLGEVMGDQFKNIVIRLHFGVQNLRHGGAFLQIPTEDAPAGGGSFVIDFGACAFYGTSRCVDSNGCRTVLPWNDIHLTVKD